MPEKHGQLGDGIWVRWDGKHYVLTQDGAWLASLKPENLAELIQFKASIDESCGGE